MNSSAFTRKKSFTNSKITEQQVVLKSQLINRNMLRLSGPSSLFSESLTNIIKDCGGVYNLEEEGWLIQRQYLDILITMESIIQNQKLIIEVDKIPDFIDKIADRFDGKLEYKDKLRVKKIDYSIDEKLGNIQDLPKHFNDKLYNFQKKGIEFCIQNFGRALIADEMGIGKTVQALALACTYRKDWPFLIISPSSLILNWRNEVYKWMHDLGQDNVQIINQSTIDIKHTAKVLIVSYELALKMCENLIKCDFQMIVVDEAHCLKSLEARRTENIVSLIKRSKRILLLTGSPAFARPMELFNLLNILRPDAFSDFKEFGNRYCDPKPNKWSGGLDYSGEDNIKELRYILTNSIMMRRLKKDLLRELPLKRRQKIEINVDAEYAKQIQEILKGKEGFEESVNMSDDFMDIKLESNKVNTADQFLGIGQKIEESEVIRCYLNTGLAKLTGIREYLKDLLQNDVKLLVFAHHIEVLNGIEDEVRKTKKKYVRIDQQTNLNIRQEGLKLFQEDESVSVAILFLTGDNVGLTLTAASTVVFAEMPWTLAIMLQTEDRVLSIGHKERISINYHYLYGEGTLDSLFYEKLEASFEFVPKPLESEVAILEVESRKDASDNFDANATKRSANITKESEKSSSGASELDEKFIGMQQITAYFKKKQDLAVDKLCQNQSQNPKQNSTAEICNINDHTVNEASLEQFIEEYSFDRKHRPNKKVDKQEAKDIKNSASSHTEVLEAEEIGRNIEELEENKQEINKQEDQSHRMSEKWIKFENSVFYSCLNEIWENERKNKEEDINTKDIRTFFDRDTESTEEFGINNKRQQERKNKARRPKKKGSAPEGSKIQNSKQGIDQAEISHETTEAAGIKIDGTDHPRSLLQFSSGSTKGDEAEVNDNDGKKHDNKRSIESLNADLNSNEIFELDLVGEITKKIKEDT